MNIAGRGPQADRMSRRHASGAVVRRRNPKRSVCHTERSASRASRRTSAFAPLAGAAPGGAVELHGELDLVVRGVHQEDLCRRPRHASSLDERRHPGRTQHVQAAPDLEFALAARRLSSSMSPAKFGATGEPGLVSASSSADSRTVALPASGQTATRRGPRCRSGAAAPAAPRKSTSDRFDGCDRAAVRLVAAARRIPGERCTVTPFDTPGRSSSGRPSRGPGRPGCSISSHSAEGSGTRLATPSPRPSAAAEGGTPADSAAAGGTA